MRIHIVFQICFSFFSFKLARDFHVSIKGAMMIRVTPNSGEVIFWPLLWILDPRTSLKDIEKNHLNLIF